MLRAIVLLLVGFLSACGGASGFYRTGATYQDFYRDLRECEAEASQKWSFCSGDMCGAMRLQFAARRNRCMLARDWIIRREAPKFVP